MAQGIHPVKLRVHHHLLQDLLNRALGFIRVGFLNWGRMRQRHVTVIRIMGRRGRVVVR